MQNLYHFHLSFLQLSHLCARLITIYPPENPYTSSLQVHRTQSTNNLHDRSPNCSPRLPNLFPSAQTPSCSTNLPLYALLPNRSHSRTVPLALALRPSLCPTVHLRTSTASASLKQYHPDERPRLIPPLSPPGSLSWLPLALIGRFLTPIEDPPC